MFKMNICVFLSNRKSSIEALKIIGRKNSIVLCVFEEGRPNSLSEFCLSNNIKQATYKEVELLINDNKFPNCDWGVSFLYHKIIKENVIKAFNGKLINFHPSPIHVHKGVGSFCYCIYNEYKKWGCTAHYLTPVVDGGDIIMQNEFDVPKDSTALSLNNLSKRYLLELLEAVMKLINENKQLPRMPQDIAKGVYYGQKDLDKDKMVTLDDGSDEIDRKIKSFWYPPYTGANIEIDGKKYTLVNDDFLRMIAQLYDEM